MKKIILEIIRDINITKKNVKKKKKTEYLKIRKFNLKKIQKYYTNKILDPENKKKTNLFIEQWGRLYIILRNLVELYGKYKKIC